MKTKFIEGTNEQYSIREDGVVTRHYNYHPVHKTLIIKDKIMAVGKKNRCYITINEKNVVFNVIKKAKYYFPPKEKICIKCKQIKKVSEFTIDDGYSRNVCKKCKTLLYGGSVSLNKSYISGLLNISINELSDDLYDYTKSLLKVKRELAKKTGKNICCFRLNPGTPPSALGRTKNKIK
jgi:hypothetical protein